MSDYYPYPKRDPIKNYFPLPNEIFLLDLTPGELAVYSYLMRVRGSQDAISVTLATGPSARLFTSRGTRCRST